MQTKNTNSFNAKFYRLFYGTGKTQFPTNSNVYYFKLFIAYVFFLPIQIICVPSTLMELYFLLINDYEIGGAGYHERFVISGFVYVSFFFIFILALPLGLFFHIYESEFFIRMCGFGLVAWLVIIVTGFVYLIDYLWKNGVPKINIETNIKWEENKTNLDSFYEARDKLSKSHNEFQESFLISKGWFKLTRETGIKWHRGGDATLYTLEEAYRLELYKK